MNTKFIILKDSLWSRHGWQGNVLPSRKAPIKKISLSFQTIMEFWRVWKMRKRKTIVLTKDGWRRRKCFLKVFFDFSVFDFTYFMGDRFKIGLWAQGRKAPVAYHLLVMNTFRLDSTILHIGKQQKSQSATFCPQKLIIGFH